MQNEMTNKCQFLIGNVRHFLKSLASEIAAAESVNSSQVMSDKEENMNDNIKILGAISVNSSQVMSDQNC